MFTFDNNSTCLLVGNHLLGGIEGKHLGRLDNRLIAMCEVMFGEYIATSVSQ